MINGVEIFSGAGGLAKGLAIAGVNHRVLVERNKHACCTLRENFNGSEIYEGDIRDFDFGRLNDIDLLAGGPPCQPFSLGGKAKGERDERDMFPYAVDAIRAISPKAFIFENVKGMLRESFREYFEYILLQLQFPQIQLVYDDWQENCNYLRERTVNYEPTYNVTYNLVNAADYGVPQKRERVIIVGIRSDLGIEWSFPSPTHSEDALLWSQFVTDEYWNRHGIANTFDDTTISEMRVYLKGKYGMFRPELQPWLTIRDVISDVGEQDVIESKAYPGHTGSFIDEPSKTIKAGAHGVPGGENMVRFPDDNIRYLTIDETKRIQTFPDNYSITGSRTEVMRQLGNAVPVRLAFVVASSLVKALAG